MIHTQYLSPICILLYNKTRNEKSLEYSFITNAHFVFLFFSYISFSFHILKTGDQFKFYNIIHLFCLMVVPKNKTKTKKKKEKKSNEVNFVVLNWIEEFLVIFVS